MNKNNDNNIIPEQSLKEYQKQIEEQNKLKEKILNDNNKDDKDNENNHITLGPIFTF